MMSKQQLLLVRQGKLDGGRAALFVFCLIVSLLAVTLSGQLRMPKAAFSNLPVPVSLQASLPERIVGVDYGPFRDGQSPLTGVFPTAAQMQQDMPVLKQMAGHLRTYSVTNGFDQIPGLAKQAGLKVVPTAWLSKDSAANTAEIAKLITVTSQNDNISFVAVGSEALLRGDLTKNQLLAALNQVKQAVSVPVTTAEPWHIWRDNPDL